MGIAFEPHFKIDLLDLSDNTQVNSGGNKNTQSVQPDVGFCYQILHIYGRMDDAVGSTAGTHWFSVAEQDNHVTNYYTILYAQGNSGTDIIIGRYYDHVADTVAPASTNEPQNILQGSLWATYDHPIYLIYYNNLDANQTANRPLYVRVKIFKEGV